MTTQGARQCSYFLWFALGIALVHGETTQNVLSLLHDPVANRPAGATAESNTPQRIPDELADWMHGHLGPKEERSQFGGQTTQGEVLESWWQLKAEPRTWVPVYIRNKEFQDKGLRQLYLAGPPRGDWLAAILDAYSYTDDAGRNTAKLVYDRYGEVKRPLLESADFSNPKQAVRLTKKIGRNAVDVLLPAAWDSVGRIPLGTDSTWYSCRESGQKGSVDIQLRQLALTGDPEQLRRKIDQVFFPVVVRSLDSSSSNAGPLAWTYNRRPTYWGHDKILDQEYPSIDARVEAEFNELARFKKESSILYKSQVELFHKHAENAQWIHDWLVEYLKHTRDESAQLARKGFDTMLELMKSKAKTWGQAMEEVEKFLKVTPPGADGIYTPYRHWLEYFRGEDLWRRRFIRAAKDGLITTEAAHPRWITAGLGR
jgi:hypothetical protein